MRRVVQFLLFVLTLAVYIQYQLKKARVDPVSIVLPELEDMPQDPNDRLAGGIIQRIGENDLIGPESLAVSSDEKFIFMALGDGRIVRMNVDTRQHETVLGMGERYSPKTCGKGFFPSDAKGTESDCGRPLGITLVKASTVMSNASLSNNNVGGDEEVLLVAEGYRGLVLLSGIYESTGPAMLHVLATRAESDPEDYSFRLLNGIVQAPDHSIYFSETSTVFQRRRILHAAMDGRPTGRLLRYRRGKVKVVADNIYMPNGITLTHSKHDILIVSGVQVLRFNLRRQRLDPKPFIPMLPGTGDNINTELILPTGESKKCYWAGLGTKFAKPFSLLKTLSERPKIRSVVVALVGYKTLIELMPKFTGLAVYDESGTLIETYQDSQAQTPWISEAVPAGDLVFFGSWYNPFLGYTTQKRIREGRRSTEFD